MTSQTEYRLLGPLDVVNAGAPVPVTANKQRVLLATLLLRPRHVVPLDDLVERLWAAPPSDARGTAQAHMQRLRRTLEDASGNRAIRTVPRGYLIDIDGELDLERFDALTQRARAARAAGDDQGEVALLRDAQLLWRGQPLANVASDFLHRNEVPALTERRLSTVERRCELELLLGDPADIVAELTTLTREEPFREGLWTLLMRALYRTGRQSAALAAFREISANLREELGLDPSPELRLLRDAILNHSPELEPGQRRGPAAGTGPWRTPSQLPPPAADFVGREEPMRLVLEQLGTPPASPPRPVVVITGQPGIGKTTLAVRAAHALRPHFPDGQVYLRLGGPETAHPTTADVLADLLRMLAADSATLPASAEHRASLVRDRLASRRVLLVLDDVGDVEQARLLLPGTGACGVLITSGHQLTGLAGAAVVRLGPLRRGEAVQLLERIVGARVRQQPDVAGVIAARCADVPLALRIAGARLALQPWTSLPRFAEELRDPARRLDTLKTRDFALRSGLDRHYLLLSTAARTLLRALGGAGEPEFSAGRARALAGVDEAYALEELLEANLVEPVGVDTSGESSYALPALVAMYASGLARLGSPPSRCDGRQPVPGPPGGA